MMVRVHNVLTGLRTVVPDAPDDLGVGDEVDDHVVVLSIEDIHGVGIWYATVGLRPPA